MAKLTVVQMITIAKSSTVEVNQLAKDLELKPARIQAFRDAENGDVTTSPLYQLSFWKLWAELEGDENAIASRAIAESLQKVEKVEKIDDRPVSGGSMDAIVEQRSKLQGKRFVFTSAQNNTDVHQDFLKSLKSYCAANDAQLVIGQFVYNKNGFQNGVSDDSDIWYAHELRDFFLAEGAELSGGLAWCGELNILPTAKYPLTGLEQHGGYAGAIVPHAKIAMESVATASHKAAKLLYATGAVTLRNYIQKKSGQMAESEHCYGALVVEFNESHEWFARQIQTDESGIFYDLDCKYFPNGDVQMEQDIAGVNWGDLHAEKSDGLQLEICQDILDALQPEHQFFHDCFDMTSRNHHNRKSGHFLMSQYVSGETVAGDLEQCAQVLAEFDRDFSSCHVVESNHDLALESWLDCNQYDFKNDPVNALTYLELQTELYSNIQAGVKDFNLLEYALTGFLQNDTLKNWHFMKIDESFELCGIEKGMHGHIGANGSRGSPKQFRKLAGKATTGHTHTASIHGSVYTAGVTGSLEMGYNKGFSSWSHSHVLTYPNGFRTIITTRGNDWRSW